MSPAAAEAAPLRVRILAAGVAGALVLAAVIAVLFPGIQQQAQAATGGAPAQIAAGGYHSCHLESGKIYCWGYNTNGQLGRGTGNYANAAFPVPVAKSGALAGKTMTQVSANSNETCALDSTGLAYCWGSGPLGNGTSASTTPVAVSTSGALAGKTLTQISAGTPTCALDTTGAAYCWSGTSLPQPVSTSGVLAGKTLTQIASGTGYACALSSAGVAYCWSAGQAPQQISTAGVLAGKTLTQVSAGFSYGCGVASTGQVYCWGTNYMGQLGDGSTVTPTTPVAVVSSGAMAGQAITAVTAGYDFACALSSGGAVYCWGDNGWGELGNPSVPHSGGSYSDVPVAVTTSGLLAGKTLTQITAGYGSVCGVDATATAVCWGAYFYGDDMGDNTPSAGSYVPVLAGPQAPASVTATPTSGGATVQWQAPASLDGGALTGYTATASPGGRACSTTTATTCVITGLASGSSYQVTVVTHTTAGDSGTSAPANVTPAASTAP